MTNTTTHNTVGMTTTATTTRTIKSGRGRQRGVSLLYATVTMVMLCLFMAFAVDVGRVQLAKTELRRTADAAALAAANALGDGVSAARLAARDVARKNPADGRAVELNTVGDTTLVADSDIQYGKWDVKTRTFTRVAGTNARQINAVRVRTRRVENDGIPMAFGRFIGKSMQNVEAVAIAYRQPQVDVDQYVPATANPFLSGMPKGTVASLNNPHNSPDYAGDPNSTDPAKARQSPLQVNDTLPLEAGEYLTFDSIDGTARHDPNLPFFNPDGELTDIGRNTNGAEHGISDLRAPINALVGVFLSDEAPNKTAAPAMLDYSSPASRDRASYEPKLKQLFWIGDGLTANGARQKFVVPEGATRLYLATWDFYEWNNNAGSRNVKVERPQRVLLVK